ncbi:MAG: 4-(cytidine 5'-diphospho)-2-C-methyl-D-erythritol kinase [Candidatus Kapaibacterium sp.]
MKTIIQNAPCKINIGLEILNKRSDGYHNINTIFHRVCLSDSIEIAPCEELIVETDPPMGIPMQENLVYKAAQMLLNNFSCRSPGAKITLRKQIPSGGGLGGGSSDAATAMLMLTNYWRIPINIKELYNFAMTLGSDIPFFLHKGTAVALGRGEQLQFFNYTCPYWILLVNPNIHIPTAWAYSALGRSEDGRKATDLLFYFKRSIKKPEMLKRYFINDFEEVVFRDYPEIEKIKKDLYQSGAIFAQLSGSGATVFGFFNDKAAAFEAKASFPQYFTHMCPPEDDFEHQ